MAHICQKGGFQLIGLFSTAPCRFKFTYHVLSLGNIIYANHDTVNISLFIKYGSSKDFYDMLVIQIKQDRLYLTGFPGTLHHTILTRSGAIMGCQIARFSFFVSLIRKAFTTKRDILPLYDIVVRNICQSRINIVQYQFILTNQMDHSLFALKKFFFRTHNLFVKIVIFVLPQNTFGDILSYHHIIGNFRLIIMYKRNGNLEKFYTGQISRKKTAQVIKIIFCHETHCFSFSDLFLDFIRETGVVE